MRIILFSFSFFGVSGRKKNHQHHTIFSLLLPSSSSGFRFISFWLKKMYHKKKKGFVCRDRYKQHRICLACEEEPTRDNEEREEHMKMNERRNQQNRQILKLLNTCHYISARNGFQNYFEFFSVLVLYKMEDISLCARG